MICNHFRQPAQIELEAHILRIRSTHKYYNLAKYEALRVVQIILSFRVTPSRVNRRGGVRFHKPRFHKP